MSKNGIVNTDRYLIQIHAHLLGLLCYDKTKFKPKQVTVPVTTACKYRQPRLVTDGKYTHRHTDAESEQREIFMCAIQREISVPHHMPG